MIVVDASVVIGVLIADSATSKIDKLIAAQDWLVAPELIDLEITNVLRRLERLRRVSEPDAASLLDHYLKLRILRFSVTGILGDIWKMRQNLTAYDASYVALAISLELTLYTRDAKLAAAAGHGAKIVLI
ncbi:MAG: type II toxin-antitoxin system VapC family toxin [Rhizobiales bacterium]|nr:type II toxin-antitoxin system VapC family toxin [Hyphomicrobiales bacterium]